MLSSLTRVVLDALSRGGGGLVPGLRQRTVAIRPGGVGGVGIEEDAPGRLPYTWGRPIEWKRHR